MTKVTCSRRTLLASIAAALGAAGAGSATLLASTRPAVAVEGDAVGFEAADTPTVEHNDGRVEAVFLRPAVNVSWSDFGSGVAGIDLELGVAGSAGIDLVYSESLDAETLTAATSDTEDLPGELVDIEGDGLESIAGSVTLSFARADVTERGDVVTTESLSDSDLDAGESTSTTLELVMRVDVRGAEGEAESVVETATFDVTVQNPDGDTVVGGEANTDAE